MEVFSQRRGEEARAIVEVSHAFDRPGAIPGSALPSPPASCLVLRCGVVRGGREGAGVWGFLSFVLPIVLDSVFARALPGLCKPNFLAYTKDPKVTFVQARARKLVDRLLQGAVLAALLVGLPCLLAIALRTLQTAVLGVA